ncbi:hypothetical protein WKW79_31800 [Variovorax robiniae]|uniref:Uncharacterized protein n=1 Tax=Variovorax robiniae TaxID=1836199 RepID=A0ABU8XH39_9BURK
MQALFFQPPSLLWERCVQYERVKWFLFESLERERRLNVKALYATPPFATLAMFSVMHPLLLLPWACLAISSMKLHPVRTLHPVQAAS